MNRSILTLAFTVMATSAMAAPLNFVDRFSPPSEFDHEPSVAYTVTEVPILKIGGYCAILDRPVFGCTLMNTHTIYIRGDLSPAQHSIILRHEKAHINGWVHPD